MKIKDFKKVCDEYAIFYRVGGKYVAEGLLEDLKDHDNETIHKIYFNQYSGIEIFLEDNEFGKMSKADRMFMKLGFINTLEDEGLYSRKNKLSVEFKNKEVRVFSLYGFDVFVMDIELSLAIHEKMKELGWLNEKE